MSELSLFNPAVVRCAFCPHVVESYTGDPGAMHDEMEAHYTAAHRSDIAAVVGPEAPVRRRGTLPDTVECPECITAMRSYRPDLTVWSRADLSWLHDRHEPMNPSQTGAKHRAEAKRKHAEWAKFDPYLIQPCPTGPDGAACVHGAKTGPNHGGRCAYPTRSASGDRQP